MAGVKMGFNNPDPKEVEKLAVKAYIIRDYNAAVTGFSKAIELIVAKHGDQHESLGSIYLQYGKALLQVSREETEALGDAVTQDLSDSDSEEEEATIADAAKETESNDNKTNEASDKKETNGSETETEKMDVDTKGDAKPAEQKPETSGDDNKPSSDDKASSEDKPSGSGVSSTTKTEDGESTEEKVDEDPTDLQLAWEVLELAKLIFEKQGDEGKRNLAETLVTLGEVSLESENFESAIADIKQGLEIQKEIFSDDSRNLAETHYKLAIALSTNNQIDEAVENYNTSLTLLRNKLAKLKEESEQRNRDQIEEIQGLIPEIEEKISDMKSFKEETTNKILAAMAAKQLSETKFEASSSTKQASDITHLVKRKRKLEDVVEDCEANPAKKQPDP